jgi:hypothetical protein
MAQIHSNKMATYTNPLKQDILNPVWKNNIFIPPNLYFFNKNIYKKEIIKYWNAEK